MKRLVDAHFRVHCAHQQTAAICSRLSKLSKTFTVTKTLEVLALGGSNFRSPEIRLAEGIHVQFSGRAGVQLDAIVQRS